MATKFVQLFATLALLVTCMVAGPSPASADSVVVVKGHAAIKPSGLRYTANSCSAPNVGPSSQFAEASRYDTGSGFGDHALGWKFPSAGSEVGPLAKVADPLNLSVIRAKVNGQGVTGQVMALFDDTGANFTAGQWIGRSDQFAIQNAGWVTLNAATTQLTWTYYSADGTPGNTYGSKVSVAAFAALYGYNGSGAYVGYLLGCNGGQFYLDGLAAGSAGNTTTYDFEAPDTTTRLQWSRDGSEVGNGDVTVRYGQEILALGDGLSGNAYTTGSGTLFAKPWGASAFTKVADGAFNAQTYASFSQVPERQTTYQFVSAATDPFEGGSSAPFTVYVEPVLKAFVLDGGVRQGQAVGMKGKIKPGNRGTPVTLERKVGNRWKKIAKSRTGRGGSFQVSTRGTSPGKWVIRLVVGAGSGNGPTRTNSARVTVARKPPPPKPKPKTTQETPTVSTPTAPLTAPRPPGQTNGHTPLAGARCVYSLPVGPPCAP